MNRLSLIALGLLCFHCTCLAGVSPSEKAALVAFYHASGGPSWTTNTNWLVGDPCDSEWYGVTCDVDSNVIYLQLENNNLIGMIPSEIGDLTGLIDIDLGFNQLSGPIPVEVGSLSDVTGLRLHSNELTGTIPTQIGNMTKLIALSLHTNQLNGAIPASFGNLDQIYLLSLGANQLSGPIPTELGDMSGMEFLFLELNQLSGPIPDEMSKLTRLHRLSLASNQLTGSIPASFGDLIGLWLLSLYDNQLDGSIPATLGNLPQLEKLYLSDNRLEGQIPAELANLADLERLSFNGNKLSGAVPEALLSLPKVEDLYLNYNALFTTDTDLDAFLDDKAGKDWSTTQTVAPAMLGVSAVGAVSVTLSWEPIEFTSADGHYVVYQATSPGGLYHYVGHTVDKLETSYTVTGLELDRTYYFTIRTRTNHHSLNMSALLSGRSVEVSARTKLAQPAGVNATDGSFSDYVGVSWTSVPGAARYRVYRCDSMGSHCGDPLGYPSGTSFKDFGGVSGGKYGYRVKACLSGKCGDYSEPDEGFRGLQARVNRLTSFDGGDKDDVLLRHSLTGEWYINFMNWRLVLPKSGSTLLFDKQVWEMMGTGDFNRDDRGDVLLRNRVSGVWWIYLMNGRAFNGGKTLITTDLDWVFAGIDDFDGDGKDDILLRHWVTGEWYINFMNWRLVRPNSGLTPLFTSLDWQMMGTGDFNKDGRSDVLLRHKNTGIWWMYLMRGRVKSGARSYITQNRDWVIVGIDDFDGDGSDDVLLRHRLSGLWLINFMDSQTVLPSSGDTPMFTNLDWEMMATGDFNCDGRDDVLLRNSETGVWWINLMDGREFNSGKTSITEALDWQIARFNAR